MTTRMFSSRPNTARSDQELKKFMWLKPWKPFVLLRRRQNPPVITAIMISLSGSNGTIPRLVLEGVRLASVEYRDGGGHPLAEHPGDEGKQVFVNSKVPAGVKPLVNLVHTVSGGDRKLRKAETLDSALLDIKLIANDIDLELRLSSPLRLGRHDNRVGQMLDAALEAAVTASGVGLTEVRQGRPGPNKTGHRYRFSISRCLLPATAGDHARAGLISNTGLSQSGQVDGTTTEMAGSKWRTYYQFSQAKTMQRAGLLALNSATNKDTKTDRNKEGKRPNKGARLSRR